MSATTSSNTSGGAGNGSGDAYGRKETYFCNLVHELFVDDPEYDSVEFSPKNKSCYKWELIAAKSSPTEIALSLRPQFMENVKDKILCSSYTLTVEDSDGTLMNQWKVETTAHSERENAISHVVVTERDSESSIQVCVFITFSLKSMQIVDAVPKRRMPIRAKVRDQTAEQVEDILQYYQTHHYPFRSFWITSNAKVDKSFDRQTLCEKSISSSENKDFSLALEIIKGSVSIVILAKIIRRDNLLTVCRIRYDLVVENAKKDKIANWNVDCYYSPNFSMLHMFPLTDVSSSTVGNLTFYLNGSFDEIIPSDDKVSNTGLSMSGCRRELSYYAHLLKNHPFSDVTLIVDDGKGRHEFPSNRAILAARSPVFATMFENDKNRRSFEILDTNSTCVKNMLNHIYSGKFDENMDLCDAKLLLHAAHRFELLELKNLCELKLIRSLRTQNILELFQASEVSSANDLQCVILDFISENKSVYETVNKMMKSTENPLTGDERYKFISELIFRKTSKMLPE